MNNGKANTFNLVPNGTVRKSFQLCRCLLGNRIKCIFFM